MSLPAPGLSSRWFARPLILGVAVLLTLFSATGFLGLQYWHERQAASLSLEHSRQVLDTLDRLRANIADLEAEWRGYLLTLDPTYLKPYGVSDESVRREGEALQTLAADDPLQSLRAAHLTLTVSAKLREMDDIIKTARMSGLDAALAINRSMDEIRSQIDQMVDHERFLLVSWETRAEALEQRKTWLIAASVVIVTVLAGAALALARLEARRRRKATEENIHLQSDLEEREKKIRRLVDANIIGGCSGSAQCLDEAAPASRHSMAAGDELPPAWARMAIPDISLVLTDLAMASNSSKVCESTGSWLPAHRC
jgi:CHASE3 domain sensor protein